MAKVAETGTDVDPLFSYNNYKTINHYTKPTHTLFFYNTIYSPGSTRLTGSAK